MLRDSYPYYLASRPVAANADLVVTNKYTQEPACRVAQAEARAIEAGIAAAARAAEPMHRLPAYRRQAVLQHIIQRVTERHEELAHALCIEAGKPIRDARVEVTRMIDTFRVAAEEAVRITGEYLPLDVSSRAEGLEGIVRRVPVGPCSFICPFNFPLNLVAHKVAPALAVGCPFVLKPASRTPVGALILGEILAETDLPEGAFSILPCARDGADLFTTDERLKLLSFTGSAEAGWELKARAGKKKVVLELGGNAGCIVDAGVDLDYAAGRLVFGAFYQSGQSCISVQRIVAHRSVYEPLKQRLGQRAAALKMGDPLEEDTFLGPLISEEAARRVESWVDEAAAGGAHVVVGGRRHGVFYEATLLENVEPRQKVSCQEVFGPVTTLQPFEDFAEAVRTVNAGRYGLQAGVFTPNLEHAFYAFNELEVGGVVINDVPSVRVDSMPYGGVKDSGLGREGVRYAMQEMTEPRLLLLSKVGRLPGTS
ncbi:MAG TPA: aldehyde dehydrogenase family protein [Phycisphaerae bacterium]|nr:aldehyde dehydrogenase family protein [Phycisphaerae bacterium]HNU43856.1 aldehyde dehydrogenase family protein [Phycisphaerae bacterium]